MTLLIGFEDRSPPLRFESLLNSSSVSRWLLYTHGTLLKPTQRFSRSFHGEFPSPLASRIGVYERKVKLVQRGLTSQLPNSTVSRSISALPCVFLCSVSFCSLARRHECKVHFHAASRFRLTFHDFAFPRDGDERDLLVEADQSHVCRHCQIDLI